MADIWTPYSLTQLFACHYFSGISGIYLPLKANSPHGSQTSSLPGAPYLRHRRRRRRWRLGRGVLFRIHHQTWWFSSKPWSWSNPRENLRPKGNDDSCSLQSFKKAQENPWKTHHADSEDQVQIHVGIPIFRSEDFRRANRKKPGKTEGAVTHLCIKYCSDYFRSEFISWITVGWFRPQHWDDYFINNGVKPSHCFGILNIWPKPVQEGPGF